MSLVDHPNRPDATLLPSGQQKEYVVLSAEERAKGFVRPYRDAYRHVGPPGPTHPLRDLTAEEAARYAAEGYVKYEDYQGTRGPTVGRYWTQADIDRAARGCCRAITTMGRAIAETYARQPSFYGAKFCGRCGAHFPVGAQGEFTWYEMDGTDGPRVGT